MTPTDAVVEYMRARIPAFSAEHEAVVREVAKGRSFAKGEFLQRAGEIAKYGHFVARGCIRSYSIDEKGREHTLYFAPEDWWITDINSIRNQSPSDKFIEAIEDSDVVRIDWPSHDRLIEAIPGFAAAFAVGLQKLNASRERRILSTLSETAEQRYERFIGTYPTIPQRVPLRMIASYLGMTPETLSRVRKQIATQRKGAARAKSGKLR